MNAVLRYPGAKNRIADWITSWFPKHTVYLEPFCGSASVLLEKKPSRLETINDIDGNVVNLFKVLRDHEACVELCRIIDLTPWSREEYEFCKKNDPDLDKVEQARRFLVRSWQGISGAQRYSTGFKHSVAAEGPIVTKAWSCLPETLISACKRIKDVQIECGDGIKLVKKFDVPGALIYIDPPYPHGTRKNYLYKYEMEDSDHIKLLETINACKNANIIISGYECDLYDKCLQGWAKQIKNTRAEAGQSRKEVLWMNYLQEMRIEEIMDQKII